MLTRYWITFEYPRPDPERGVSTGRNWEQLGFGVTAEDVSDALGLLRTEWFDQWGVDVPPVRDVTENVDVSAIQDRLGQVMSPIPFMNPPTVRGMWFPTTKPLR